MFRSTGLTPAGSPTEKKTRPARWALALFMALAALLFAPLQARAGGVTFTAAAGSYYDGYGLGSDGNIYAWGFNYAGDLGNGSTADSSVPVKVDASALPATALPFKAVAAGHYFAYALGSDGNIYAWGQNSRGALGDGTNTTRYVPVQVDTSTLPAGALQFTAVAAGTASGYGLGSDGNIYAWGANFNGQLGNGLTADSYLPVQVDTSALPTGALPFTAVAAGQSVAYGLGSDGMIYAWGQSNYGQLGNVSLTYSPVPVPVSVPASAPAGFRFTAVAVGTYTSYGLGSDGKIYAWGYGDHGQFGNGSITNSPVPVPVNTPAGVPAGFTFTAVASNGPSGYGLGSDGNIYAWGTGNYGQLGNNATSQSNVPVKVDTSALPDEALPFTKVGAAGSSGYGLGSDGNIYAWGYNGNGDLGNNSTTNSLVPVQVFMADWGISLTVPFVVSGTYTFPARTYGYATPPSETVTVTNAGNQDTGLLAVSLSGANPDKFQLSTAILPSLTTTAGSNSTAFTLLPVGSLDAGTYTVTVTVNAAAGNTNPITPQTFDVSFTVNPAIPAPADFSFTPASATYDGGVHPVTVSPLASVTGMGAVTAVYYNGSTAEPTAAGTYEITIDVDDGANYAAATGLSLGAFTINLGASLPPVITIPTSAALPNGTVGVAYSATLAATGTTPITWALASGSTLPPGLTLNAATGWISGTPMSEGVFSFSITARNPFGSDTQTLSFQILPAGQSVALDVSAGSITIDTTASTFRVGSGPVTPYAAGDNLIITGSTIAYTVAVSGTGVVNITLNGASIDLSAANIALCAFCIAGSATVNLTLVGDNTLTSNIAAGLGVPVGTTLLINGVGSMLATSNFGSGIGGSSGSGGGTIIINGGDITATSSSYGAGIGGSGSNSGNITINGGTVRATGNGGAGIGNNTSGGTVTINGGTVTATGGGWAGIGSSGGNITLTGGTVTATGGNGGAGIGGSGSSSSNNIIITGGDVTAIGGGSAAGIGGGSYGASGTITISGGTVTATGGASAAGIGGGYNGAVGRITITGDANVTANGNGYVTYAGAGIGSSSTYTTTPVAAGTIVIDTSGTVIASGGSAGSYSGAPIGQGNGYSGYSGGAGIAPVTSPADVSAVPGSDASFSITVTSVGTTLPTVAYQWQQSIDGGTTWTDIPGGSSDTLDLPAVTTALSGYEYRAIVTVTGVGDNSSITYTTHAAKLTVAPIVITITTQPDSPTTVTAGSITGNLTVAATVSNGATPAYQWVSNTTDSNSGGTAIAGATSATFAIPTVLAAGTYYYYCLVSAGGAPDAASSVAIVKVNAASTVSVIYAGQPLAANATINQPGTLSVSASSAVGIVRIQASLDGSSIIDQTYNRTSPATASLFLNFASVPNGSHTLSAIATDSDSIQTSVSIPFTLDLGAPLPPIITAPADGSTTGEPQTGVAGSAEPGAQVQLYLDGQPAGAPITASTGGSFASTLNLPEGLHQITASASNNRGTSAASNTVSVTYNPGAPTVVFISPGEGATLSADTNIEVSALDTAGIAQVQIYAGDQLIGAPTTPPWSATWDLSNVTDGPYTLRALAASLSGRTAQASRSVTVQKAITPPAAPPPPYVTRNVVITPALSFGDTPIQISGDIVSSDTAQPVPTAALRMILTVQGFERRLNLVGDAAGHFSYSFVPQSTDAGTYEVRIVHPDDAAYASETAAGSFTINRLSVNYSQYKLNAIRGIASAANVNVTASAGSGATGVNWQALPADQPSGSLPPGITLDAGSPIDIAAGTTAPMSIKITGDASAGMTGTIILKLFANESGSTPRAELRVDYQLYDAQPGLTPDPTALEIGVQQGNTASGVLTITNKGYSPALGVKVQLLASDGSAAPTWAHLVSSPNVGAIDIGQSTMIQIDASPDASVPDGYTQLQIKITADNDPGGSVPVTVAVAQNGQGGVRFQMVDIYTNTLDAQGQPIPGLQGARITLQNEALTNSISTATSNASGIAEFSAIAPGNYRWRASAPNHTDASGRITVSAGLTANQRVFLDYQLVSIEFSVTETTIQDVYDIVLEATFQTQVPAPVVLLEPLSINLPAMQVGEEITGELTLSNYGLVRADNLQYALPTSDENFKYEFYGTLPTQLAAKTRVAIPYKITSLQLLEKGAHLNTQSASVLAQLGASYQPSVQVQNAIRKFLSAGDTSGVSGTTSPVTLQGAVKAASCSSYQTQVCATFNYDCAAGDQRSGSSCSSFGRVTGAGCADPGDPIGYDHKCPPPSSPLCRGGDPKGPSHDAPTTLVSTCTPTSHDCQSGTGTGGGGGGGGGSFGGGGGSWSGGSYSRGGNNVIRN